MCVCVIVVCLSTGIRESGESGLGEPSPVSCLYQTLPHALPLQSLESSLNSLIFLIPSLISLLPLVSTLSAFSILQLFHLFPHILVSSSLLSFSHLLSFFFLFLSFFLFFFYGSHSTRLVGYGIYLNSHWPPKPRIETGPLAVRMQSPYQGISSTFLYLSLCLLHVLNLPRNWSAHDLPGGAVVKNLPPKAGNVGSTLVGEPRSHMPQGN